MGGLKVRTLGLRDYTTVWKAMQDFTEGRDASSGDELWLVEHLPVYTLGLNGKPEHLLDPGDVPVVAADRGGQITYRLRLGSRQLVMALEQAVIDLLAEYEINAVSRREAPGVYVNGAKIAAVGLRVRRGCCYHGLSLNVAMDLEPYSRINPCGYPGMAVTQLGDLTVVEEWEALAVRLADKLAGHLGLATVWAGNDQTAAISPRFSE